MLLRDSIYNSIRRAILTCEIAPGQELREQELAARYRVSRSPIRDSLLRLEQEQLVTVLPRQGYSVNRISEADIKEIFGLRVLIEPACAAAAAKADDAALQGLDRFRGFVDEDFDGDTFVAYNESFHSTIARMSGSKRLATVASDIIAQFERLSRIGQRAFDLETAHRMCAEHDAIIDALQDHDADRAARLSYEHADGAQQRLAPVLGLVGRTNERSTDSAPALKQMIYCED
jgi:GntR family transcriptional regulator, rspAB operon transcriptional repressor